MVRSADARQWFGGAHHDTLFSTIVILNPERWPFDMLRINLPRTAIAATPPGPKNFYTYSIFFSYLCHSPWFTPAWVASNVWHTGEVCHTGEIIYNEQRGSY